MDIKHTVLVVDDDRRLRELLLKFFKEKEFIVWGASLAAEARVHLAMQQIDVIILDVMMPGENGFEFAKNLRESGNQVPILFLTAKDSLDEKKEGFQRGADDYLTKPFEPDELLMRVQAILRRSVTREGEGTLVLQFGPLQFILKDGTLEKDGDVILLSSTESILLKTLAQAPRQPFSREDLAQRIGHKVSERSVDVQITRLRRKIGDDPKKPRYIQTVRHIGYTLCPDNV